MIGEIRHLQSEVLERLWEEFFSNAQTTCGHRGVSLELASLTRTPPTRPPMWLLDLVHEACRRVDPATVIMPSGAGHDTGYISHLGAAMIFVPSVGGRSHCPEEETLAEHLECGLRALREAVLALDRLH